MQEGTLAKAAVYEALAEQARALVTGETDFIANAANIAALLYHGLPGLNWAGFYRLLGNVLVLGPFQGNPACLRIPVGKGVCGTCAQALHTIVVPDVHAFPGHIACDSASRSEIVLPLLSSGRLTGVLDLDSPMPGRFDEEDARGLETIASILMEVSAL